MTNAPPATVPTTGPQVPPDLVDAAWLEPRLGTPGLRVLDCTTWMTPQPVGASRIDSGGKRVSVAAAKAKREGLKPGVSDIMILWGGRLICIELKTSTGRQSPEQKEWADSATCAGAAYYVARSVEQVEEFLDAAGVPLRARTKSAVGRASVE